MEHVAFPKELLDRAKRGEAQAFQELYARARAFAYRLGVGYFELAHEDAEDVGQEVTWSLHRNLASVEHPDSWLFAAVRNHVLRLSKEPRHEAVGAAERERARAADPCADLWDCILRLSQVCRRLVLHLFFWGYTERELAERQQVHGTTVHKRKRKCFGSLFSLYQGEGNARRMLQPR